MQYLIDKISSAHQFSSVLAGGIGLALSISLSNNVFAQDKAHVKPPEARDYAQWKLPKTPPYPANNHPNEARVALGKMLFFDPRLSGDGTISCATCHNPSLGWSDGLPTGRGFRGKLLDRASPSIVNSAFNTIHMWDGRKPSLEEQAIGPMEASVEMNTDFERFYKWMNANAGYRAAFAKAYPNEEIGADTLKRAIAAFERTIVSRNSPFDRWLNGDKKAMTAQQIRGMVLFNDTAKTNCTACHSAPNFTDNGFHNIGLASYAAEKPDLGRYEQRKVNMMKGAFKTPALRDVASTAPYFHDGSAKTLAEVMEHYNIGGVAKDNLSPNIKALNLSSAEKEELVAFMRALSSPPIKITLPILPTE